MKKMIRNKKFRVITLISFLTSIFLIGIFFSKVIFTPTNTTEAFIIDGVEHDESEFPNVARLFDGNGNDHCTGTLIDSTHVLTAAHCLIDFNSGQLDDEMHNTSIEVRLNGQYYQSKAVYVDPTYLKEHPQCKKDTIDVAIIELSTSVPSNIAKPVPLNNKKIPVDSELVLAGYGLIGNEFHGANDMGTVPSLGKINVGKNTFDGYGFYNTAYTEPTLNANSNYFYWDFDLGESNVAFGDSGGPVFYNGAVAGIPSCGGFDAVSGDFGLSTYLFATRVDKIIPWINNVLSGKITATPDPAEPPFVYDDGGGFKFTFTDSIMLGANHKIFMDAIEYNSYPKEDGTYNLMAFMGAYGEDGDMSFYNTLSQGLSNFTMMYKKKGVNNYVEQMKITKKIDPHSDDKTEFGYKIGMIRYEIGTYDSPDPLVTPGQYTISVFVNGKVVTSVDICLPSFKSKTGVKIGKVVCPKTLSQSNINSGPQTLKDFTANGDTATDSQTINETETTTFLASDKQQFSGTSTKYNEISMNGLLTPTIEGDDLSIDGSLTYSYKNVPVNDINKGGKISVQLVDGDGNKSKIVPMNVVPAGEITEYNKPYFFNPTFDNYRRFANENGTSVTTDRNGPFTLNITDDALGITITDIPVVDVVISGGMEAFNEGGGMAPESENNDPALQNNVNNPSDGIETKKGLLRNPLRSGLDSIPDIVSALVKNIVIPIAIPFLALSIIYTGFLFIQARGNAEKLKKAKEALKWTLIGGAIILASYVIATALQGTIADIIR